MGRGIMGIQNYVPCFDIGRALATIAGRQELALRDHSATKLAFILSLFAKLADFDRLHKTLNIM